MNFEYVKDGCFSGNGCVHTFKAVTEEPCKSCKLFYYDGTVTKENSCYEERE